MRFGLPPVSVGFRSCCLTDFAVIGGEGLCRCNLPRVFDRIAQWAGLPKSAATATELHRGPSDYRQGIATVARRRRGRQDSSGPAATTVDITVQRGPATRCAHRTSSGHGLRLLRRASSAPPRPVTRSRRQTRRPIPRTRRRVLPHRHRGVASLVEHHDRVKMAACSVKNALRE